MSPPELIPNGVPLAQVPGLTAAQIKTLNDAWIVTAQELVALAACPESVRGPVAAALRVDMRGLDRLAEAAHKVIPAVRSPRSALLAQEAVPANYGLGALLDEPPEVLEARLRLPPYAPPGRPVLPTSFSLLDQLPPLRNQGVRGTCVAHAVLALREQMEISAGAEEDINLSEQFVYWWCKQNDGIPTTSGTYVSTGMRCLEKMGAPPEAAWPYVSHDVPGNEGQGPPPAAAATGDPAMRIARVQELNRTDITGIKTCLTERRGVAFSIPVYNSWYHSTATSRWGKITLPIGNEAADGGHAMTLVGYQDDPEAPGGGYFLVRNSWQPWAYDGVWQEGYGYIPYAYISRYATAVFSGHRLTGADLYVRDNPADTGRRPLAAPTWNSPDIWLRQTADGGTEHQEPLIGAENAIYVRVVNRGPAYAYDVRADVLMARLAPYIPLTEWQPIGRVRVAVLPPGPRVLGPLAWIPTAPGPYAFQVRLDSCGDPLDMVTSPAITDNLAERRLWQLTLAPGETRSIGWQIATPADAGTTAFAVDRTGLPADVTVSEAAIISPLTGGRRGPVDDAVLGALGGGAVLLAAGREANLTITLGANVAPGSRFPVVVSQLQDGAVIGKLNIQITVGSAG